MSPLPGWLAGAQHVCINMSPRNGTVDLPVQLHFALFKGSGGYVLKPAEMRAAPAEDVDAYWPPPREQVRRVTLQIISLHNPCTAVRQLSQQVEGIIVVRQRRGALNAGIQLDFRASLTPVATDRVDQYCGDHHPTDEDHPVSYRQLLHRSIPS